MTTIRIAERCRRMGTEAAFRVFARAKTLESEGRDVIHLEQGPYGVSTCICSHCSNNRAAIAATRPLTTTA